MMAKTTFVGSSTIYNDEDNLEQARGLVYMGVEIGNKYALKDVHTMLVRVHGTAGLVVYVGDKPTQEEAEAWFTEENDLVDEADED